MDLKLAMISSQPFSTMGGLPLELFQLGEALVSLGVDLDVIVPASEPSSEDLSYPFRVTSVGLKGPPEIVRSLEYCYRVYKYIEQLRTRPDAVHGSQWSPYFLVRRQRDINLPIVTRFHGTSWYGALTRVQSGTVGPFASLRELAGATMYLHAEKTVAARSTGLTFLSASVKREVESMTGRKIAKSSCVIHCGVNVRKFRPLDGRTFRGRYGISTADRVALYVGRLDPLKGVDRLILASGRLMSRNRDLRLVIAGAGERSYMARLLSLAKPRNRFVFTGWIGHDELAEVYAAADIVVSPSYYSDGNVVLEAMACGKPVLVVPGSGFSELVNDSVTGFVVNGDMESCLESTLCNEKMLRRVGRAARVFAVDSLSWKKAALKTLEFIRGMMEWVRDDPV